MLLSLRAEQISRTLEWIKSLEHPQGGIRAWEGSEPYPEVSGYLIPTLIDYGEGELAMRLAEWLLTVQKDDGSFPGLDGVSRSFDTSACMEGLYAGGYMSAADRARAWIQGMVRSDGAMRVSQGSEATHFYTMRASWLIGSEAGAQYWLDHPWQAGRTHYLAYGLEGLLGMDQEYIVRQALEGAILDGELCAMAQMAILKIKTGLDASELVREVTEWKDPLPNSWTAKWCLDMLKVCA